MLLEGKVALVTGGATGIGRAISAILLEEGARVAVASRDRSHLEAAEADFKGRPVLAARMDVRKRDEVEAAIGRVAEKWGEIHILVNNAGISGLTRIDDPDDGRWDDILATNLTGAYLVTKAALRLMKDHAEGRIINVSSVLGKFGVPGYAAYCASKHGVIGFTKALALELAGRGITVNAICPGWVDTEMARLGMKESAAFQGITTDEFARQAIAAVPLKRFVEAEEVARLVLYLASDAAGAVTGQAINMCGGQTMI